MVPVHFAVDVTLNREQKITAAFAGDIFAEHRAACAHAKDTAMRAGAGALRRRADDQLRLSARPEPVSGGEGHVGGGEDRQAAAARSSAPPNAATACPTHGSYGAVLASQPIAGGAARDDLRARLLGAGSVAGAGAGADSDQGRRAGEDRRPAPGEVRAAHFTPIDDVAAAGAGDAATRGATAPRCACCRKARRRFRTCPD